MHVAMADTLEICTEVHITGLGLPERSRLR